MRLCGAGSANAAQHAEPDDSEQALVAAHMHIQSMDWSNFCSVSGPRVPSVFDGSVGVILYRNEANYSHHMPGPFTGPDSGSIISGFAQVAHRLISKPVMRVVR